MKKTVLVFISFCCSCILFGQKSVVVADSTYNSYNFGQPPTLVSVRQYSYNENCLDTLVRDTYIDPFSGQTSRSETQYTYNPDSLVRRSIQRTFDSAANVYNNESRVTYRYIPGKLNYKILTERWDGSNWQPISLQTIVYRSPNQLLLSLTRSWNSTQKTFVNSYRQVATYDSGGQQTSVADQSWDTTINAWLSTFEFKRVFDAHEFLTSDTTKFTLSAPGTLSLISYQTYYNNSVGLADSSFQVDVLFNDSVRRYYTYYSLPGRVRQSTSYYFYGGVANGGFRNTYTYDSTETTTTDSIYVEQSEAPLNDSFTLSSIYVDNRFFNSYHQQVKYISNNIEFLNGVLIDSSRNIVDSFYAPCQSLLPVTQLRFSAAQKNSDALVQWQTTNEINTAYFTVERSRDGIHFTTVGKVSASGNFSSQNTYSLTDNNIFLLGSAKLYYRLAEYSNKGAVTYSKTAELTISNHLPVVSVSPNPVRNALTVYTSASMPDALVKITGISGNVLYSSKQNLSAGSNLVTNISSLARGIYIVSIQTHTATQTVKIIKE